MKGKLWLGKLGKIRRCFTQKAESCYLVGLAVVRAITGQKWLIVICVKQRCQMALQCKINRLRD